jgi:hypothetical protein
LTYSGHRELSKKQNKAPDVQHVAGFGSGIIAVATCCCPERDDLVKVVEQLVKLSFRTGLRAAEAGAEIGGEAVGERTWRARVDTEDAASIDLLLKNFAASQASSTSPNL